MQHDLSVSSLYNAGCVLRRAREYKKRRGSVKDPRRRDIAPTGELAGLPARDAPKTSEVWPRSIASEAPQFLANNHAFGVNAHKRSPKWRPDRFHPCGRAAPAPD